MVEFDYDQVLSELKKLPSNEHNAIPEMLEHFIQKVAKNGEVLYSWDLVKPLFLKKLEQVMDTFHKNHPMSDDQLKPPNCQKFIFEDCKKNILAIFCKFNEPPFTTQRLCEILIDPGKHYRRLDKLMRGIERNVLVVSPLPPMQDNYWEDFQKESPYKDLYTNCNLANSFKASFEETDDAETSELINEIETNGENSSVSGSSSYDNASYMTNNQHSLNTFYDHIQQQNSHMLDSIVELHSQSPHHSHSQTGGLAPLQQLDSFTNVFASTTTHLTHLSSSSTTYPLDASMSTSSWSATHLKGPYEDVIQHSDDSHNDDNENIIVDDEEDDDEEETGATASTAASVETTDTEDVEKIVDPTMEENKNFFYSNESQAALKNVPHKTDHGLSVNTDEISSLKTESLNPKDSDEDDQSAQESAFKKRLSPTPLTEEVIAETEDTLTPKKIKIADHSPEEILTQSCNTDNSETSIDNSTDKIVEETIHEDSIKSESINDCTFDSVCDDKILPQEAMEH